MKRLVFLVAAVLMSLHGTLAADGLTESPGLRQPAPGGFRRKAQIAGIGGDGVARRPCLSRHHLQKPLDQREVFAGGQSRVIASTAIIRA